MSFKIRYRLSVNVTHDDYAAVMALAQKARTSPSALLQHAIRHVIKEAEQAIPLIPPASSLPSEPPSIEFVKGWEFESF